MVSTPTVCPSLLAAPPLLETFFGGIAHNVDLVQQADLGKNVEVVPKVGEVGNVQGVQGASAAAPSQSQGCRVRQFHVEVQDVGLNPKVPGSQSSVPSSATNVGVAGLKHQLQPPHEVQHNSKAGSALLLWQGARQRSQSL